MDGGIGGLALDITKTGVGFGGCDADGDDGIIGLGVLGRNLNCFLKFFRVINPLIGRNNGNDGIGIGLSESECCPTDTSGGIFA